MTTTASVFPIFSASSVIKAAESGRFFYCEKTLKNCCFGVDVSPNAPEYVLDLLARVVSDDAKKQEV